MRRVLSISDRQPQSADPGYGGSLAVLANQVV
jgi:hypothetical protein